MYSSENEKLIRFIELRNKYIDLLDSKLISKSEFNHMNNEIFSKINLRPFSVLDSFEKALYNYNYYNSKAKICLEEYNRHKNSGNERKATLANNNKVNNYNLKDKAIIAMIKYEDSCNIKAYNIFVNSISLDEKIFEIYFINKERIILHTLNEDIKNILIKLNCFDDTKRESLISSYINN